MEKFIVYFKTYYEDNYKTFIECKDKSELLSKINESLNNEYLCIALTNGEFKIFNKEDLKEVTF